MHTASTPARSLVHRRGLNASLETIRQGLQPIAQINSNSRDSEGNCRVYFLFANGQLRRQIGEGHSTFERGTRRLSRRADRATRRLYKKARIED